jgi:hypothetical protein
MAIFKKKSGIINYKPKNIQFQKFLLNYFSKVVKGYRWGRVKNNKAIPL